jgi:hypothetical protein
MLLVTAKALPGHRHSRIFQVFSALERVRQSRQRTEVDINENQATVFALKHEHEKTIEPKLVALKCDEVAVAEMVSTCCNFAIAYLS